MAFIKKYAVVFTTPPDEFDPGGENIYYCSATTPEAAEVMGNVWYYGETKPTCKPPHPVKVVEV